MRYYISALKNYVKSDGRATRKEFWWFMLFHYLFVFVFAFIDAIFDFYPKVVTDYYVHSFDYGYTQLVYLLVTLCPSICIRIRRLHDIGKSGSWWWLGNLPIVSLYMIYLYCKASEPRINAYGYPSNYTPTSAFSNDEPIDNLNQIRFCRKCGNKLFNGAKFCNKCGIEILLEIDDRKTNKKKCEMCYKETDHLSYCEIRDEYGTRYRNICKECISKYEAKELK